MPVPSPEPTRTRFTIVELMIVVAIIAILAAIAIPAVATAQFKARRAEVPLVQDGMHQAMIAWEMHNNSFLDGCMWAIWTPYNCDFMPPNKTLRTWDLLCTNADYEPDGKVRGCYRLDNIDPDNNGTFSGFFLKAYTDVDANGAYANFWSKYKFQGETYNSTMVTPANVY